MPKAKTRSISGYYLAFFLICMYTTSLELASRLYTQEKVKANGKSRTGYFGTWVCELSQKLPQLTGIQRDKKSMSGTPWPHCAPSWASAEEQTFPRLVNCCGTRRRVCLPLINPFLNYRAEGRRRNTSSRMSLNEPPSSLSPTSCLLTSSPVCLLAAPVCASVVCVLVPTEFPANFRNTAQKNKTRNANKVHLYQLGGCEWIFNFICQAKGLWAGSWP